MGRFVTKELISLTMILVFVFLVLTHASGASRTIGALGTNYGRVVKTLQGR